MTTTTDAMTAELKRIGAQMANVMFNLAQLPGERITYQQAEAFDSLRRQWDVAVRSTPPSTSAAPSEQDQAKLLPARRFVNVAGFWDADYVEFAEGQEKGGGVLNGIPHHRHYTRRDADSYVAEGAWREVAVPLSVGQSAPAGAAYQGGNTSDSASIATPIAEGAREAFEAWSKRQGHDVVSRLETGGKIYVSSFTRHAWAIWQAALASRPAADVELPPLPTPDVNELEPVGPPTAFSDRRMRAYGQECARAALAAMQKAQP